jgi:hypothetical protein
MVKGYNDDDGQPAKVEICNRAYTMKSPSVIQTMLPLVRYVVESATGNVENVGSSCVQHRAGSGKVHSALFFTIRRFFLGSLVLTGKKCRETRT